MRSGKEIRRDLGASLRDARVVELAADETQQRRFNLGVAQLRPAGDEPHDRFRDLPRHELAAGLDDGGQRLLAGHPCEAHPVLRDGRHRALQRLEMREIVLAQRDQHAIIAAREVEALGRGVVLLDLRLEVPWRPVLDEIGKVLDELGRALAAKVVALRDREDLLELVENQQRRQRPAVRVPQHVVAVVEELPQRLSGAGHTGLRPLSGLLGRFEYRLLDLLGRRRRLRRVIDAYIDRAIADRPQPRQNTGAQDRRLAEAGLAEQQRQQLALNAARKLGDLLFPPVEERLRFLGERREAQPRVLRVDRWRSSRAVERRHRSAASCARKESPAGGARTRASRLRRAVA